MRSLARVLMISMAASLLLTVAAKAEAPRALPVPRFTRWVDPIEHAFTVELPEGWHITGGTHRDSAIDARSYVSAGSPDGQIKVWFDDLNICHAKFPIRPITLWDGTKGKLFNRPLDRF